MDRWNIKRPKLEGVAQEYVQNERKTLGPKFTANKLTRFKVAEKLQTTCGLLREKRSVAKERQTDVSIMYMTVFAKKKRNIKNSKGDSAQYFL